MRALTYIIACLLASAVAGAADEAPVVLRVGFFPNLTHAPALVARQLEREGADWHLARLPKGSRIEWRSFNAGPSAMEALLAGAVDLTYVGQSPVINAHVRTKGADIRLLAPVARGGNALVVRPGLGLKSAKDFLGRRVGTPQLGNTQDVDARSWLREGGVRVKLSGGEAQVIPVANAELMLLFARGDVDAAWTVEPWVTRLTSEFGGEILVEKKDAIITVLASSKSALAKNGKGIEAFVRSHYALRDKLLADRTWHEKLVIAGIGGETRSTPPKATLIGPALGRVIFDAREDDAARKARLTAAFTQALKDSQDSGLLKGDAPVAPLLESLVADPAPSGK